MSTWDVYKRIKDRDTISVKEAFDRIKQLFNDKIEDGDIEYRGGVKINIPLMYGTNYPNYGAKSMGRIRIGNEELDTANITGKKLAEIGRWALTGQKITSDIQKEFGIVKEDDYTSIGWLDMRIEEICRKGRL